MIPGMHQMRRQPLSTPSPTRSNIGFDQRPSRAECDAPAVGLKFLRKMPDRTSKSVNQTPESAKTRREHFWRALFDVRGRVGGRSG
jgi:hypothetical protein